MFSVTNVQRGVPETRKRENIKGRNTYSKTYVMTPVRQSHSLPTFSLFA